MAAGVVRRSSPTSTSFRAATALVALAVVATLAVAGVFLVRDQHRRRADADARLIQQSGAGAAMLGTLRQSSVDAIITRYGARLRAGADASDLRTLDRLMDAPFSALLDAKDRVIARSAHSPYALGERVAPAGFALAPGGRTATLSVPLGHRGLVVAFAKAKLQQLLKQGLGRVPSAWPADLYIVDARGHIVSTHSTGVADRPAAATSLEAWSGPKRSGDTVLSTTTIPGTDWGFTVVAARAEVDASTTGAAILLPWSLLGVAALAGCLILLLVLRARQSAEALEGERERALAVLAVLPDGYLFLRDGVVVDVNARLCALTGVELEELVGAREEHPVVAALREGGAGLTRPDGTPLELSVSWRSLPGEHESLVGVVRDVAPQRREERRLTHLASTDSLTGLGNRGAFDHALGDAVARSQRDRMPLSLVLFDVDHFKAVNDEHGHPVGDRVLAEIGRRLAREIRDGDVLARIGGEEFAWLLPGVGADSAHRLAERTRRAIGEQPFAEVGELTLSAGICARGSRDAAGLYACADKALLTAKRSGRDRTVALAPVPVGRVAS